MSRLLAVSAEEITAISALVGAGLAGLAAIIAAVRSPGKAEAREAAEKVTEQAKVLGDPNGFRSITAMITEVMAQGTRREDRLIRIESKVDDLGRRVSHLEEQP